MGFLVGRQSEAKDRQDEKIDRLETLFETQASTMAQQSVVMNSILKKMEDEGDSDKKMTASVSRKTNYVMPSIHTFEVIHHGSYVG